MCTRAYTKKIAMVEPKLTEIVQTIVLHKISHAKVFLLSCAAIKFMFCCICYPEVLEGDYKGLFYIYFLCLYVCLFIEGIEVGYKQKYMWRV